MRELYIEEYKPTVEPQDVKYEFLEYYYDTIHNVCVKKIRLNKELDVDKVYSFTYIDCDDDNTYNYIVLKRENGNIYFIAEYYGKLYITREKNLVRDAWIKMNVEELGINLNKYK